MNHAKEGYVYIATNPALGDMLKIGATTHAPHERVKQLSGSTSSPAPFTLAYSRRVAFPFTVEAEIHEHLDVYRVNDSREFFDVPVHEVIKIMQEYPQIQARKTPMPKLSFAELFATFPDDGNARELTEEEQAKCQKLMKRIKR